MRHLIRDPVHLTIPMSSEERRVINHPLFQRLRRIRQTAFLNLVFPGATHDRFSHSLGAMHLAGLAFDHASNDFNENFGPRALQPDQKDYFKRILRFAALIHDAGHGPFSHSLEDISRAGRPIYPTRKEFINEGPVPHHWIDPKGPATKEAWLSQITKHEEFSIAVIAKLAEADDRLGGVCAQDVAALLCEWVTPTDEFKSMDRVGPTGKWSIKAALKSMVSGELDCDRMDYLLRDSHYTGVPYGKYDKEMLLENVIWRPHPRKPRELSLAIRKKALRAFEDFLMSRYHMFLQLYSHKTVVGFDIILENALAELPDFHIKPDLAEYFSWSDEWLLKQILENRSSVWGAHIRDRIPLKHLFTVLPSEQKVFNKFIKPFELSPGSTVWFPSLKSNMKSKSLAEGAKSTPKLWWRQCTSYLTKEDRGSYPMYLEDRSKMIPIERASLLLQSDYVRRFDLTHVYCLRQDKERAQSWLLKSGVSSAILEKPQSLVD